MPTSALQHQILQAWPAYLAYLVSFLTISAAWMAHSALTDRLTRSNPTFTQINLLLLLLAAFLPFSTKLVTDALALHNTDADTGLRLDLVVNVMKGNTAPGLSSGAVESIAKGFGMPDDMRGAFGLAPRKASPATAAVRHPRE